MDLEILSELGSKERTLAEYINLLNKTTYELKQLHKTKSCISIIEAVATATQN
jgi:hypothetical protein